MNRSQLSALPTKALLGRLRSLQQCEDSIDLSDRTGEELLDSKRIQFKDTLPWQTAYDDVKEELSKREHVPTREELKQTEWKNTSYKISKNYLAKMLR